MTPSNATNATLKERAESGAYVYVSESEVVRYGLGPVSQNNDGKTSVTALSDDRGRN